MSGSAGSLRDAFDMLLSRMMGPIFFFNKHEISQGGCNVIDLVSVKLGSCLA